MTEKKDRDPRDISIGRNLAELRGEMTQVRLAAQMRERGWKWSQATVWAIERGERPLRLGEAVDALEVLDLPRRLLEDLLEGEGSRFSLRRQLHRARREREDLLERILQYYGTRDSLVTHLRALSTGDLAQLAPLDVAGITEVLADDDQLEHLLEHAREVRRERVAVDANSWPDERVLIVGSERIESDRAAREELLARVAGTATVSARTHLRAEARNRGQHSEA